MVSSLSSSIIISTTPVGRRVARCRRVATAARLVQGDRASPEVGADAHLLGGPDENAHPSGAAGIERASLSALLPASWTNRTKTGRFELRLGQFTYTRRSSGQTTGREVVRAGQPAAAGAQVGRLAGRGGRSASRRRWSRRACRAPVNGELGSLTWPARASPSR